jgi:CubicO group peptidase (beta-lactamase class C family)
VIVAADVAAQRVPVTLDSARVVASIRAEMQSTASPGASIAIVIGDRVAYAGAFGVRSVETRDTMTTSTLVRLGSVTKTITGLTAAILASEKRVDLRVPVSRYDHRLNAAIGTRTLHQLLTHTAGFADEGAADGSHDPSALERRVLSWGAERIMGDANDIYSYASPGYWLAGYILQRADSAPYAEVVARRVLRPLGMTQSTFNPLEAMTRAVALDHRVASGTATVLRPFQDDASTWPSGSLFSSAAVMGRLAIALLNAGRIDGEARIDSGAIAMLLRKHASLPGSPCGYSYGLSICDGSPVSTASHYGFRVGSGAVFTLVPAARIGVVILANRNGAIFRRTENVVLRMLLGDSVNPPAAALGEAGPASAARRRDFVGRWASGRDTLHVTLRGDSVFYRYGSAEQPARVMTPDALDVLDRSGAVVQRFRMVRGAVSGVDYLTDGLNAFRRQPVAR